MDNLFRPFCILASGCYYDVVYMVKIGRNDPYPCGSRKKYKHCCYQKDIQITPTLKKEAEFTLDDGSKIKHFVRSVDSIPVHNHLGLQPNIPKEEMNIIPDFSYGDISMHIGQDDRFEIFKMQVCSLKGTDPFKLIMEKLSI